METVRYSCFGMIEKRMNSTKVLYPQNKQTDSFNAFTDSLTPAIFPPVILNSVSSTPSLKNLKVGMDWMSCSCERVSASSTSAL